MLIFHQIWTISISFTGSPDVDRFRQLWWKITRSGNPSVSLTISNCALPLKPFIPESSRYYLRLLPDTTFKLKLNRFCFTNQAYFENGNHRFKNERKSIRIYNWSICQLKVFTLDSGFNLRNRELFILFRIPFRIEIRNEFGYFCSWWIWYVLGAVNMGSWTGCLPGRMLTGSRHACISLIFITLRLCRKNAFVPYRRVKAGFRFAQPRFRQTRDNFYHVYTHCRDDIMPDFTNCPEWNPNRPR